MRPLSTAELIDIWGRGLRESSPRRAFRLLAAACDESADELAGLSLGERDARLLTLREWAFGPDLMSLATCPQCHQQLELALPAGDLLSSPAAQPEDTLKAEADEFILEFRLPTCADLAAAEATGTPDLARELLERCLISASRGGQPVEAAALPPMAVEAIEREMDRADPRADVRLAISCASCSHQWRQPFDILSFFWAELHSWAPRILHEVHALASAYGWREAEILKLPAWRREFYLQMVAG